MTSRQLAIRRGQQAPLQRFSVARASDSATSSAVAATLNPSTIHAARRTMLLSDPTKCSQFACIFGDSVGFLTRPEVFDDGAAGDSTVIGSFSDTIGHDVPVELPVDAFQGFFTTLVRAEDAEHFRLLTHPVPPDTVRGPAPADPDEDGNPPGPVTATLARLQFPPALAAGANVPPEAQPRIVALPCLLPLAPGQSYPDPLHLQTGDSQRDTFRLFEVWRQGLLYVRQSNAGYSVTKGGPLFYLQDLAPNDPFPLVPVLDTFPAAPTVAIPVSAVARQVRASIKSFSDDTWIVLGQDVVDDEAPGGGPGLSADQISALVGPIVEAKGAREPSAKEAEQKRAAADVAVFYRLALASAPPPGSEDPSRAVLPELTPMFQEVLSVTKPVVAAQRFQDHLSAKIEVAYNSDLSLLNAVTFEAEACTTAFANAIRSFHWLTDPLSRVAKPVAQSRLCFLHFLTPDRAALLRSKQTEAANSPLVLSHVADDKAQLEASKASSLYTGGRVTHADDLYAAVVNLRLVLSTMISDVSQPLVLVKLLNYIRILKRQDGRAFMDCHRMNPHLPVYLFQDIQHILGSFFAVSRRPSLREALTNGEPVAIKNYQEASRTADSITDRLVSIITGTGLGDFRDIPICATWFIKAPHMPGKAPSPPSHSGDKHGIRAPPPDAGNKRPKPSPGVDSDRAKSQGILVFAGTAGNKRLPTCPVFDKSPRSGSEERCCMQFMTREHFCSRNPCPYPHVVHLARLSSEEKRNDLVAWVNKTQGLSFAPGKGPAGTTSG